MRFTRLSAESFLSDWMRWSGVPWAFVAYASASNSCLRLDMLLKIPRTFLTGAKRRPKKMSPA